MITGTEIQAGGFLEQGAWAEDAARHPEEGGEAQGQHIWR